MSPQLAVNFVRTKLSMKCDLEDCAKELVFEAIKNRGSVDNVTVVILSFHMFQ
jgi:serine/threonine protein phosphatase PrpC